MPSFFATILFLILLPNMAVSDAMSDAISQMNTAFAATDAEMQGIRRDFSTQIDATLRLSGKDDCNCTDMTQPCKAEVALKSDVTRTHVVISSIVASPRQCLRVGIIISNELERRTGTASIERLSVFTGGHDEFWLDNNIAGAELKYESSTCLKCKSPVDEYCEKSSVLSDRIRQKLSWLQDARSEFLAGVSVGRSQISNVPAAMAQAMRAGWSNNTSEFDLTISTLDEFRETLLAADAQICH